MVVAAYGLILPQWVLDTPRLGCLNIHASLLPRWRGAAPIHRAIEAGDAETGVTIMQMDAGLDTGDMLLRRAPGHRRRQHRPPARPPGRAGRPPDRRSAGAGRGRHAEARCRSPAEGVTYAHKIEKHEAQVDWTQPAAVIVRRIRAFDPFPGASSAIGGEAVKLWAASAQPARAGAAPGTVLAVAPAGIAVATGGRRRCVVTELQRPGGKRLPVGRLPARLRREGRTGLRV